MDDLKPVETINVAVLIFDDVDLMDVTGPIEVFDAVKTQVTKTDTLDGLENMYRSISLFQIHLISFYDQEIVTTSSGISFVPHHHSGSIDLENYQIIVIPGGKGVHHIRKDPDFIAFLEEAINVAEISLSVCTGAYAVAMTGHMDEDIVTTHWRHLELFQEEFPQLTLANNVRYTSGHKLVSAGGVTAGIDGALAIVAQIVSEDHAQKAADLINYPWMG